MPEYIKTVEDFVKDHINEKITLKMMSDCVYLSQFHFSRKFKKETGLSPKQYVLQLKIANAEDLLVSSDKKVYEIAEEIGYEPSRFCNLFKEYKGVSPSAYREARHTRLATA
ncbi:MAG: helix-turn-helix transcriptional regulator [Eubacterium sp.]|nr:helix-turn-helix transcriptional regulator [Eubacterium sp.]